MVSEQFYEIFKYQPDIRNIIFDHQKSMIALDAKILVYHIKYNMLILDKFVRDFDMKIQEYNRQTNSKFNKQDIIQFMAELRKWSIELEKYDLPMFDTGKYGLHITDIIRVIDYDNQLWSKANHSKNFYGRPYTNLYPYNLFWIYTYMRLCTKYKLEYDIFNIDYHDNSLTSYSDKNIKHIEFNEGSNITIYETDLDYFIDYITDNNLTDKIIVRKNRDGYDFDIKPLCNMLEYGYDSRIDMYINKLRFKKFERNIIFRNKSYKYFEYLVTRIHEPYEAVASIIQTDIKVSDREKKWYE